jgi:hypothetical protein
VSFAEPSPAGEHGTPVHSLGWGFLFSLGFATQREGA